jgi:hypothetical protein
MVIILGILQSSYGMATYDSRTFLTPSVSDSSGAYVRGDETCFQRRAQSNRWFSHCWLCGIIPFGDMLTLDWFAVHSRSPILHQRSRGRRYNSHRRAPNPDYV